MKHLSPGAAPLVTSLILAVATQTAFAASHREAPGITEFPKLDSTDVYAFRSYERGRDGYVTIIANYMPLQFPGGGPNYFTLDPDARYQIHIDNDGDAVEDMTFSFDFRNRLQGRGDGITVPVDGMDVAIPLRAAGPITRRDRGALNEIEQYSLDVIYGDRREGRSRPVTWAGRNTRRFYKPLDFVGTKTLPQYERYANRYIYDIDIPRCDTPGKMFVGQRAEGFAVNLGPIFDLVNIVPLEGEAGVPGGILQNRANDDLIGKFNVTSLALEVPIECLTKGEEPVIGVWTTASLPRNAALSDTPGYDGVQNFSGDLVQVSRLGNPLVNEVVIGLPDKDRFSGSEPKDDAQFAKYVTNPTLPELVEILFGGADLGEGVVLPDELAPNFFPRSDLVTAFLTGFPGLNQPQSVVPSEMLRLNTAIPATPRNQQNPLGVLENDLAGFPNGRRPGDDVVDIALRVVMGRLCGPIPGAPDGICEETTGVELAPFTDGAPILADDFSGTFPYLNAPIPGAPND